MVVILGPVGPPTVKPFGFNTVLPSVILFIPFKSGFNWILAWPWETTVVIFWSPSILNLEPKGFVELPVAASVNVNGLLTAAFKFLMASPTLLLVVGAPVTGLFVI